MKTFNAQKRREIKRECRSRVSARLGTCIGANFLYGLPIVLVLLIVYITMFGSSFSLMLAGADETAVAQAMMRGTGSGIFTALLLTIVISGPLSFGLMRFYTDLSRGAQPGARHGASAVYLGFLALDGHPYVVLSVPAQPDLERAADFPSDERRHCAGLTRYQKRKHEFFERFHCYPLRHLRNRQLPSSASRFQPTRSAGSCCMTMSSTARGALPAMPLPYSAATSAHWSFSCSASSAGTFSRGGAVYLCILLGTLGAGILGGGLGLAVMVVCLVAALCLGLVLGTVRQRLLADLAHRHV